MIFLARKNPSLGQNSLAPHLPELWGNMAACQSSTCSCGDWEKSSGDVAGGWWAGVSSWKGEAPAGRTAVVQEGSSGWQSPREDVPSWPSSILKQPHGSHLGVATCGTTWAVTAGEIQGRGTDWSQIQAPKCNHALFIPPDKIYHKQI